MSLRPGHLIGIGIWGLILSAMVVSSAGWSAWPSGLFFGGTGAAMIALGIYGIRQERR